MRNRQQFYMWVSGAINIKDYTDTVTLAIIRAQIVSCSYHDVRYIWKILEGRDFCITLRNSLQVA